MPLYDYRCPTGEVFEAFFTIADKPDTLDCPSCGQSAASMLPAIGPSKLNSPHMRVLDATNATAERPQVVNSVAGTRATQRQPTAYSTNPLHRKLPRP